MRGDGKGLGVYLAALRLEQEARRRAEEALAALEDARETHSRVSAMLVRAALVAAEDVDVLKGEEW